MASTKPGAKNVAAPRQGPRGRATPSRERVSIDRLPKAPFNEPHTIEHQDTNEQEENGLNCVYVRGERPGVAEEVERQLRTQVGVVDGVGGSNRPDRKLGAPKGRKVGPLVDTESEEPVQAGKESF